MGNNKRFKSIMKYLYVLIILLLTSQSFAGDLTATSSTRITHPYYEMGNFWQGEGHGGDNGGSGPWNYNNTRIFMYEKDTSSNDCGAIDGRGLVWGYVQELTNLGQAFTIDGNKEVIESDNSYPSTQQQYLDATHQIPSKYRRSGGAGGSPVWSLTEENVFYAIDDGHFGSNDIAIDKVTINPLNDDDYTSEEIYRCTTFCSGESVTLSEITGWTSTGTLIVELDAVIKGNKKAFEVNVATESLVKNWNERPYYCSDNRDHWPWSKHIHQARSPDKLMRTRYGSDNRIMDDNQADDTGGCWQAGSVSENVSSGSNTIVLDDVTGISVGEYIAPKEDYWYEVESIDGDELTLTSNLQDSYSAGDWVRAGMIWRDPVFDQGLMHHCHWSWDDDFYICSVFPDTYYSGVGEPYLGRVSVYQVYFARDTKAFNHVMIAKHNTAGVWEDGGEDFNYMALMTPTVRNDFGQIMYLSNDGQYSYQDNRETSITPCEATGEFLLNLDVGNATSLSVTKPNNETDTQGSFNITHTLSDSDDEVTVAFYYDTDNSGFDGVAIIECATEPEGVNVTCAWDTSGRALDEYWIYGITTGSDTQATIYSTGKLTLISSSNDPPTINVDEPTSGDSATVGDNFTVQLDLEDVTVGEAVTADCWYENDNEVLSAAERTDNVIAGCSGVNAVTEGTDQTCTWNTTGVSAGNWWVWCETDDGTNPVVGDYSPFYLDLNAVAGAAKASHKMSGKFNFK